MPIKSKSAIAVFSVGLVLILTQIWMLTQSYRVYEVPNQEKWISIVIVYLVMTAYVFAFDTAAAKTTESQLFKISFIKALPKAIIAFIITGIILYGVGFIVRGDMPDIKAALLGLPFWVIVLHLLIVATNETYVFQTRIPRELRRKGAGKTLTYISQAVIFALFHFFMAGTVWQVLALYIPLGLLFYYVAEKWSPRTRMTTIGVHAAWNLFVLGFI